MEERSPTPDSQESQPSAETPTSSVEQQIRLVLQRLEEGADQEAMALLEPLHAADQAQVVGAVSAQTLSRIAPLLPAERWVSILEHLDPDEASEALQSMGAPLATAVLDAARPEQAVELLRRMPEEEAERALAEMARGEEVVPLLAYPEGTAGSLMRPVTVTIASTTTIAHAMALLRHIAPLSAEQTTFSVVDEQGRLAGSISLHALVFSEPDSLVHATMSEPVASVTPSVDQEECFRLMERYDLAELPVIDESGKLLGAIPFQEVYDIAQQEATEDMYRLVGLGIEERVASGVGRSMLQRLPWLLLNLGTVILAAAVIAVFQSTIAKMVVLAAFLPVVASQGGAAGTQTLTLVVRSIAVGEVSFRSVRSIVFHEFFVGVLNGLLLGVLVGAVGLLWEDNPVLGLALLVAMTANMVVAALSGALIPFSLRALGLDPALASVVLVTTFTDVAGFAVFLGTATVLLWYL